MLGTLRIPIRIRSCIALALACALVVLIVVPSANAQYFRFGKNKIQYDDQDWFYVQSAHFTVYYHDDGLYLADFTAKAAEEAYRALQPLFDVRLDDPVPLIVYKNHGEFAVTNAVDLPAFSESIGGVTELFKNRIAVPFTGDYRDFRRVIHHELVHALINEVYFGGSIQSVIEGGAARIPLWFNEGLAEWAALGWDSQSDMYVREAILEGHLAPIDRLGGYFAYRGGQSVWDYVAEQYGEEKIGEILRRLRSTRSVNRSFERSIGLTVDELSERWHAALREIHFPEVVARERIDQIGKPVATREHGFYNTSPALSPLGDRVAFVTTTNGLFDVYVTDTDGETEPELLIEGQTSRDFESLNILTPGLAWSPDGRTLALVVRRGRTDAVALVDVETGITKHVDIPSVEQVLSVSWHPDGDRLALGATSATQSDIYVLNLHTGDLENLTSDIFSDHEPAWSPDGRSLVFHSDRGSHTTVGAFTADSASMFEEDFSQYDVYELTPGESALRRLTADETWDDRNARFGADPDRVLFISDRNGTNNLYEKSLTTGRIRPLTDLTIGAIQANVSLDGATAAVVSLKESTPSVYVIRDPFGRTQPEDKLRPAVWAQRVQQALGEESPAARLASSERRQSNPWLRDATDGVPYVRGRARIPKPEDRLGHGRLAELLASLEDVPRIGSSDPDDEKGDDDTLRRSEERPSVASDSLRRGGVRVDFPGRIETRSAVSNQQRGYGLAAEAPARPITDENGDFVPRKYKLNFSPDIVYGAAGYDALYGVQGITQMMFSDILGNHRIIVATNLLLDLRNSDYVVSYDYLPNHIDWSFSTFHISRLLADFNRATPTYYRYRQYGSRLLMSYPLSKFNRLDTELGVVGVSQADVTDVSRPSRSRTLLAPRLTFTRDATTPGFLHAVDGSRFAMSLSGSPTSLSGGTVRFGTVLMDGRTYLSFGGNRYTTALRLSAGTSFGPNRQVFYTSGVQNWINRSFDGVNGFPISDVADFVFATPVMPLRGFDINAANGSNFGLFNAEFRFPLIAALLPGPLPLAPLYNMQGQVFADVGAVWGGRSVNGKLTLVGDDESGTRRLEDLLAGMGFGLRTIFIGYPIRVDFAWPWDGGSFGDRRTYISIGMDF